MTAARNSGSLVSQEARSEAFRAERGSGPVRLDPGSLAGRGPGRVASLGASQFIAVPQTWI